MLKGSEKIQGCTALSYTPELVQGVSGECSYINLFQGCQQVEGFELDLEIFEIIQGRMISVDEYRLAMEHYLDSRYEAIKPWLFKVIDRIKGVFKNKLSAKL